MDDRTKPTELSALQTPPFRNGLENKTGLTRRFPTVAHLRRHAPRHGPPPQAGKLQRVPAKMKRSVTRVGGLDPGIGPMRVPSPWSVSS